MCVCAQDMVCTWRSDDNLGDLVLSVHRVSSGNELIELRLSGLTTSTFYLLRHLRAPKLALLRLAGQGKAVKEQDLQAEPCSVSVYHFWLRPVLNSLVPMVPT